MKVQSVSSFRNYHTQVVNFEKKHKDNESQPQSSSSLLKAVPVAVLIAMSPLAKTNAQRPPKDAVNIATECVTCPDHPRKIDPNERGMKGDSCTIYYYDTDGNHKTAEGVYLVFTKGKLKPTTVTIDGKEISAYRCGVKEYWFPTKLTKRTSYLNDEYTGDTYYLDGGYVESATSIKDTKGNTLNIEPEVIENRRNFRTIPKALYDRLVKIYGDEIEQVTETNQEYIDL